MPRERLSPSLVERLRAEPGKPRSAYFDTHRDAPRGFCLRVTQDGAKAFYVLATLRDSGRKAWVRVGDAAALALDDARRAAKAVVGQIALGVDPNAERRKARQEALRAKRETEQSATEPTVAGLIWRFVSARQDRLSPKTADEYFRTCREDIEPSAIGSMKAKDVLRSHVRELHARLGKRGRFQADRVLVLLRAAFRWAQDEEVAPDVPLVDRDPTRGIEPHMRGSALVRTRSLVAKDARSDREAFAEVAVFWRGTESLRVVPRSFARLVLLLGLRRGEAAAARWPDIDLDGEPPVWHIPAERRKGRVKGSAGERKALDVPLPPLAVTILRELRERVKGERVFRGDNFGVGDIGKLVKHATGLHDVTIHDLRRSAASGLQRIGAPPHVVSVVLGHAEQGARSDAAYKFGGRLDEHRDWLERWASAVERIVGQGEPGKLLRHPGARA